MTAPRDSAYRVLLIEDDPGDTLLFLDALAAADPGVHIDTASSIDEAESLMTDEIDCVVLDLGLPRMSGFEALTEVRSRWPDMAVVVLTGWGDGDAGSNAVASGAQDYLVKGDATGPTVARSIRFAIERRRHELSVEALRRSEMRNVERERLERALLATPRLRRTDVSWAQRYTAARTGVVSGDFVDGVELPDGTVRAVIGDVSGHGPDEAALGVSLRAGWRALVLSDLERNCVLAGLEDLLAAERSTPDSFATVCDLTISPALTSAEVRIAGHPPPILTGTGPMRDVNGRSPLGMPFGERHWPGTRYELGSSWSIVLYTDGLFEVRNAAGVIMTVDDVPDAVDDTRRAETIDPVSLMEWFEGRSVTGWRDDVAVTVISSESMSTAAREMS